MIVVAVEKLNRATIFLVHHVITPFNKFNLYTIINIFCFDSANANGTPVQRPTNGRERLKLIKMDDLIEDLQISTKRAGFFVLFAAVLILTSFYPFAQTCIGSTLVSFVWL